MIYIPIQLIIDESPVISQLLQLLQLLQKHSVAPSGNQSDASNDFPVQFNDFPSFFIILLVDFFTSCLMTLP